MSPVLGIDLGTTNSVVCVVDGQSEPRALPDGDGNQLIPSVVSFHPAGDVLVGHPARDRRLLDAPNTIYSVKRLIGRPFGSPEVRRAQERFPFELCEGPTKGVLVRARQETYTLPEISAFVLREVRRIAEARLGVQCTRAVITVPANFNELQRSATKAAGRVAGLEVLRILNEPTAAALAYGYGRGSRERIAIFDLGGGTFDITILELAGDVFEVLSTAGDTFLGGDDVDVLVAEKMADAFLQHHRFDPRTDAQAYERLRAAAEWAKCQLSTEQEVQLRIEELAYGDAGASLDLSFGLTREALESLARPLIARAFDVCEDAMRVAGVRPTQLDNVILVGGSTRIPLVRSMVSEYFGREVLTNIDPDLVVGRGAALQGAALAPLPAAETAPQRLARVPLARMSRADIEAAKVRREQLKHEAEAGRPPQPAFQPSKEPTSIWDEELENLPTRMAQVDPTPLDDEPTRARASAPPSAPAAHDAQHTAARAGGYEDIVRASRPPEAPPRRSPQNAPGGSTLGFGSKGLPAVPASVAPAPPSTPPAPSSAVATPSIGVGKSAPPPPPSAPVTPAVAVGAPLRAPLRPALPPASSQHPVRPPTQPPAPAIRAPLLLDVTPHTLGVETVAGYCEGVIERNAAIPVEQTREFSTGADGQESVSVVIYQGESRRLEENQPLGQIELTGLRRVARGQVTIEVIFVMDADGTLGVRARDRETGQEQTIRIRLVGGLDEDEIRRMQARQAQMVGG